jgi:hypothetical protein
MDLSTLTAQVVRRWWIVAAAALIALVGALAASAGQADEHHRTIHMVLRPDRSVTDDDLPGTLDALQSDGPLVQTVMGVLESDGMLRRVAEGAGVPLGGGYSVEATTRPGSSLIDTQLSGPDDDTVDQLARSYTPEASDYVSESYSAYVLEQLSIDSGGGGGPGALQVAIVALLVGGLLGVGLVAAERLLEPWLASATRPKRPARRRRPAAASARPEPAANGGPASTEDAPAPSPESKPATRSRASSRSKTSGAKAKGAKASGAAKPATKQKRATQKATDADVEPAGAPDPSGTGQTEDPRSLETLVDDLGSSDGVAPARKPATTRPPTTRPKAEGRTGAAPARRPARRPRAAPRKRPSAPTEED